MKNEKNEEKEILLDFNSINNKLSNNNNNNNKEINEYLNTKIFIWKSISKLWLNFFDYESKNYKTQNFKINKPSTLYDNFNNILLFEDKIIERNSSFFFHEKYLNENITITKSNNNSYILHLNSETYFPLKYLNKPFNILKINSEIKIGKYTLIIHIIKLENNLQMDKNIYNFNCIYKENFIENNKCRICYSNENSDNNPLINVCKCEGSIKFVHFNCLKLWMKEKINIDIIYIKPNFLRFNINNFYCEICKHNFPLGFNTKNGPKFFFDFLDKKNYFIFKLNLHKNYLKDKKNNIANGFYMIIFNYYNNNINIGRGKKNFFILESSSVSREQCSIYIENNLLKIKDNNSKFGTLIKNEEINEIELKKNEKIVIQKGNALYFFENITNDYK